MIYVPTWIYEDEKCSDLIHEFGEAWTTNYN